MSRRKVCLSDLPAELLTSIYDRLECRLDTLNFKLVSKVWLNSTTSSSHRPINLLSPIFPAKIDQDIIVPCSVFVLQSKLNSELQPWLCTVQEVVPGKFHIRRIDDKRFSTDILENFNSRYYRVKEVGSFYALKDHGFIWRCRDNYKVVLIANPNRQTVCPRIYDYNGIVLNPDGHLKPISIANKTIKRSTDGSYIRKYDDVVNFKGNVYVIDRKGRAYTVDFNSVSLHKVVNRGVSSGLEYEDRKNCLVVSSTGELFLVRRSPSEPHLKLYKLNEIKSKWEEVRGIGADKILIVTSDVCFFVLTKDFPGWRGNSIVFGRRDFRAYTCNSPAFIADVKIFRDTKNTAVFSFEDGECKLIPKKSCLFQPPLTCLSK